MYEALLKDLLRIKLRIADSAINVLPPECKKEIQSLRNGILKAVHEVTKEYLEDKPKEEDKRTVKPISID